MTGRTTRKVGRVGAGKSSYVVLPADWTRGNGVAKGDRVTILYDSVLVIVPPDLDHEAERILDVMRGVH